MILLVAGFGGGCFLLGPDDLQAWVDVHPSFENSYAGTEMVEIPSGEFTMGGGAADPGDRYLDHDVTLAHDFWMARTELTQEGWARWMPSKDAPSANAGCDRCPVEQVTWIDAAAFANAVSTSESLDACYLADGSALAAAYADDPYACPGYRLPTEAEWEYAARAGEDTAYSGSDQANSVAWTAANSEESTHPVCTASDGENAWELCDMSGNVWEWINDWFDEGYSAESPTSDPPGPADSPSGSRVGRGGGFSGAEEQSRTSERYDDTPGTSYDNLGFRLARTVDP